MKPGINVYSFSLQPEEFQPSGACNFANVNRVEIENTYNTPYETSLGNGGYKIKPHILYEKNISIENTKLEIVLDEHNNNLIYVHDYMKMWRFLIELKSKDVDFNIKKCVSKIGKMPKEAPEINFYQENKNEDEDGIEEEYY